MRLSFLAGMDMWLAYLIYLSVFKYLMVFL